MRASQSGLPPDSCAPAEREWKRSEIGIASSADETLVARRSDSDDMACPAVAPSGLFRVRVRDRDDLGPRPASMHRLGTCETHCRSCDLGSAAAVGEPRFHPSGGGCRPARFDRRARAGSTRRPRRKKYRPSVIGTSAGCSNSGSAHSSACTALQASSGRIGGLWRMTLGIFSALCRRLSTRGACRPAVGIRLRYRSEDGHRREATTSWTYRRSARRRWPTDLYCAGRQELPSSGRLGFSTTVRKILDRCHGR